MLQGLALLLRQVQPAQALRAWALQEQPVPVPRLLVSKPPVWDPVSRQALVQVLPQRREPRARQVWRPALQ